MNGRIYDPITARFLHTDKALQNPYNTQNLNSFSYCLNNPLKYTDPSGWIDQLSNYARRLDNFNAIRNELQMGQGAWLSANMRHGGDGDFFGMLNTFGSGGGGSDGIPPQIGPALALIPILNYLGVPFTVGKNSSGEYGIWVQIRNVTPIGSTHYNRDLSLNSTACGANIALKFYSFSGINSAIETNKAIFDNGINIYRSPTNDSFMVPHVGMFLSNADYYNTDVRRHEFRHYLWGESYGFFNYYFRMAPVSMWTRSFQAWSETEANFFSNYYFNHPNDWNPMYPLFRQF